MSGAFKNLFQAKPTGEIADNIDAATSETLQDLDWSFVVATTQLINANPTEGSAQAIKCLKPKLKAKSPVVANYAISVLNACVRDCGRPFAAELSSKDNISFLHKLLLSTSLAPENRGRLLQHIAEWAERVTDPPEIRRFFHQLVGEGFRFPPHVRIGAPVAYPAPIVPIGYTTGIPVATTVIQQPMIVGATPIMVTPGYPTMIQAPPPAMRQPSQPPISSVSPQERKNWVNFDCNLADNNIQMFVEAVNLGDRTSLATNTIVQEFKAKCQDMLRRLARLIEQVTEEELLERLLKTHTSLASALDQYDMALVDPEYQILVPGFEASTKYHTSNNDSSAPTTNRSNEDEDMALAAAIISSTADSRNQAYRLPEILTSDDPFGDDKAAVGGPSLHQFMDSDDEGAGGAKEQLSAKSHGKARADDEAGGSGSNAMPLTPKSSSGRY
ncbi:hypothetical protein DFJ73DRAFT_838376 [Zopfochytrium polystomum]|nr:hypothetical protein DFJ73DRAFT_838376 [Zopfochytrium polystomum]